MTRRRDLRGQVVLLTGATGGLGEQVAAELAARGARLGLFARDGAAASALAGRVAAPGAALGGSADVQDLASLERAAAEVVERFGRIDAVIAAAGVESTTPAATTPEERFVRDVDVNLTGVWRTYRATVAHLVSSRGYFLAVASLAAFVHSPLQSSYTAGKAGVWALCDSIRLEVRHRGVDVGLLAPTFFATPMLETMQADPAIGAVWGGNRRGIWRTVTREEVVAGVVRALERRSRQVVVPGRFALAAWAPGLVQAVVERAGLDRRAIASALDAAEAEGRR